MVNELLVRRWDYGGISAVAVGPMRAGKTTLLAFMADFLAQHGERVIWRGLPTCQWAYVPPERVKLLLSPCWAEYGVWHAKRLGRVELQDLGVEYTVFYTLEDVLWKAEKGKVNVVYLDEDEDFIKLLGKLVERPSFEWCSVFCDEIQELAPQNVPDKYSQAEEMARQVGRTGQAHISFYCATQDLGSVFWALWRKLMWRIYLRCGTVWRRDRIRQPVVDRLEPGEAIVSNPSKFFRIEWPKLKKWADLVVRRTDRLGVHSKVPSRSVFGTEGTSKTAYPVPEDRGLLNLSEGKGGEGGG